MRPKPLVLLLLVGGVALVAAGCGGSDKSAANELRITCKQQAIAQPKLPADFPQPGELTYTKAQKAGPSLIVDGYWTADLGEAYKEFRDQVEGAGYKILFTEKEDHDAEISYQASATTGQIALRDECAEGGTTRVHITNRPL